MMWMHRNMLKCLQILLIYICCAFVGMNNKKTIQNAQYVHCIADLFHLVSIPQLINSNVKNFVYTMIPNSSYVFLLCNHY